MSKQDSYQRPLRSLARWVSIGLAAFFFSLASSAHAQHSKDNTPSGGSITLPVPRSMRSRARPEPKVTAVLVTKNEDGQWYYAPSFTSRSGNITTLLASFVPADPIAERRRLAWRYWNTDRELADKYLAYMASLYFVEMLCRSGQYRFKSISFDVTADGPIVSQDVPDDWQEWQSVESTPWAIVRGKVCRLNP